MGGTFFVGDGSSSCSTAPMQFGFSIDVVLVWSSGKVSQPKTQGQNLQFPKVFNVCKLQVYTEFTENVTLQVSRCVNYTVH